jgi:hypothetical protein
LVLELAQRGLQRRFDVLGIGAGAEVQQQFAHVGITLAHTGVDLFAGFADHAAGHPGCTASRISCTWIFMKARDWAIESCSSRARSYVPATPRLPSPGH